MTQKMRFGKAASPSRTGERSPPFWIFSPAEMLRSLNVPETGLTQEEAEKRLQADGPNATGTVARRHILAKVAHRLVEPLVAILVVAALIAGATGDVASTAIILFVITASIALDVTQEHRAESAVDALRRTVAIRTSVVRDGVAREILVEEVVRGDVIELRAGELVPADGLLLAADRLSVNEALLTGEAYPVEKRAALPAGADTSDTTAALFAGTGVVGGEAKLLVTATGAATRLGLIAGALGGDGAPTAFERGLHALSILILRLTLFLVLFVLLAHLVFHRPPLESFLFAVALAVGLTPELLPMITTVTLARGALRMAARQVVVKRLSSIHDLGTMDVFCTDKTGTLTEARITLVGHPGLDGADRERVAELAAVNALQEAGNAGALDEAIIRHSSQEAVAAWSRLDNLPFDFERRIASVLAQRDGKRFLISKGAPENVLSRVSRVESADGSLLAFDDAARRSAEAMVEGSAREGLRLLAVAFKEIAPDQGSIAQGDEGDLVLAGFCVFLDPPKASAGAAIARLSEAGVRTKIVSGDAAAVVQHLVETLKLGCQGILTGVDLDALDDHALAAKVSDVDLYARVSPEQKTRVIRALQVAGHVVGFMGDGINDAPAIKAADVGLSVDGATEVARATADMILLDSDLGVVADGVVEGRRTYANIMKYIRMGTSSNFGNMLSMALASIAIPFLPLTPVQVLLNNLIYDLSEIGIPLDEVDPESMAKPHGWNMREVLRFTLVMGPLSSLFDIATFAILRLAYDAPPDVFRTAWFIESMATQILVIFLIRTPRSFWSSRPHPVLTATSLGALALSFFVCLGPAATWLGFATPPGGVLYAILGLVIGYLVIAEAIKGFALGRANGGLAAEVVPQGG